MMELTQHIRELALSSGADLIGFAPLSRYDGAPAQYHPHRIFPQARSIIAFALTQPRGSLKTVEEGTSWGSYNGDAYHYLNIIEAPRIARILIRDMEKDGYTSVAVRNPFFENTGTAIREDCPTGPDGLISLRLAGVVCGLGELGHSKIFLTPQFGPRQRVYAILTDAEFEPTPLFRGKICDDCGLCVHECQAGAIGRERDVKFTIEDREFSHASFDPQKCLHIHQGLDPDVSPFWTGQEKEDQVPAFNRSVWAYYHHLAVCVGRACLRSCLDHLEKTGRIEASFRTPMVHGKRWERPKRT